MKNKYCKVYGKWHNAIFNKTPISEVKWFTDNEALLLNIGKEMKSCYWNKLKGKLNPYSSL